MTDIKWGDEIAVDGRPAWLRGGDHTAIYDRGEWLGLDINFTPKDWAWHPGITAIRLPAAHWAYPVIAAGFEPWGGGDEAPGDVDLTQPVMFANGQESAGPASFYSWGKDQCAYDIIGYKRKVAPGSEMWSASTVYEPGDVVRTPNGETVEAIEEIRAGGLARFDTIEKLMDDLNDTVTLKKVTQQEAEDHMWDIPTLLDLNLIRPVTLLDQFEAHHGGLDDNQRAIIEIYQEWVAGL